MRPRPILWFVVSLLCLLGAAYCWRLGNRWAAEKQSAPAATNVPAKKTAIAPRESYSALQRSRVLKKIDDQPVWSVSCLFVKKEHRNHGVSVQLLRAAVAYVKEQGGTIVEGYPVEPKTDRMPDVFAWTGLVSAFRQAGFVECARGSPTRPIMRFEIKKQGMRQRRLPKRRKM